MGYPSSMGTTPAEQATSRHLWNTHVGAVSECWRRFFRLYHCREHGNGAHIDEMLVELNEADAEMARWERHGIACDEHGRGAVAMMGAVCARLTGNRAEAMERLAEAQRYITGADADIVSIEARRLGGGDA